MGIPHSSSCYLQKTFNHQLGINDSEGVVAAACCLHCYIPRWQQYKTREWERKKQKIGKKGIEGGPLW